VVNLDPAAEHFSYPVAIDIRDLISLSDVMSELNYGPNGGLIYCMEYLLEHLDWLADAIADYGDDYLIFDCAGQIELYTHLPLMPRLSSFLSKQCGYQLCAVYLLDALFVTDASRFASGALMCLSAMVQLELPHVNVLSKCDLVPSKRTLKRFLDPDMDVLLDELQGEKRKRKGDGEGISLPAAALSSSSSAAANASAGSALRGKHASLSRAMSQLVTQYSMVTFFPLDLTEEESVSLCMQHIDRATAYGEDLEPKEPKDAEREVDNLGAIPEE
jgi:GTPase SAR1 family protein